MANDQAISCLALSLSFLALVGCGGSTETAPSGSGGSGSGSSAASTGGNSSSGGSGGGGGGDSSGTTTSQSASASSGTGGDPGGVTFRYQPSWKGVTAVTVIGGFGLATDWDPKQPFATLTKGADGAWTGTASLADGTYPYLFHVVGDEAAANPADDRYAMNGAASAFIACPAMSPTYTPKETNPCSQITVPESAPEALHHIKGTVTYDGAGIGGYLVVLERQEPMFHHFFEDRTVTAADGSYDLVTADASVRLQIWHPTYLSKTDAQRDPVALAAFRRMISSGVKVSAKLDVPGVEVAYHDYAKTLPTGMATLPTTFAITLTPGSTAVRASVYGSGQAMIKSIGDPWFSSPYGTTTAAAFDGTFNTAKATETAVKLGEAYFWGTWQRGPAAPAGGVQWDGESMVLPITWK